jgi:thiol:disulfide interchange protein DsbD
MLAVSFAACALAGSAQAQIVLKSAAPPGAVVQTPRARGELVAQAGDGIVAGQTFWLGLRLEHQSGWHTYWKNAGDSGLPTELNWQLPAGLSAGAIAWPAPHALRVGPLVNYGYEDTLLLPVPVQVATGFKAPASGLVDVRLSATWLICRVECIPESGDFLLQIPVQGTTANHSQDFAQARAQEPAALAGAGQAVVTPGAQPGDAKVVDDRISLRIPGLPAAVRGKALDFYPENAETFRHAAEPGKDWRQRWEGDTWVAENLPLSDLRGQTPRQLAVVLALPQEERAAALAEGRPVAWRSELAVQGRWTPAALASVSPALAAALEANQAAANQPAPANGSASGLWAALLGGLVGGLILNLMPCVFPVLAIKVVGFARHGQDDRARRLGGLAYAAGVLLSFLALGALLLALRAAGQQLGWGFQLQSPAVVALLAALFTLLGLNLAGMFEFGSLLPGRLASVQARHPVMDAFLSGVLAVAIASPCTAPFMGASLGFAIDMPGPQALTVFAALGLGMALPYLLACFAPAVVRWLPRPGAWMQTFRHAMAFPMFATVVWLVWVLGQQSGVDGAAALLALLLAMSALIWALRLRGRTRWVLSASVLLLSAGLLWHAVPLITTEAPVASAQADEKALWQPWSAERVQAAQTQGRPVFVDFTAAWCVTCQVNKRATLSQPEVLAAFEKNRVQLLRADWTRQDPAITQALHALGRSGVPVYVLYAPGRPPVVMTELLTRSEIMDALGTL